MKRILYTLLLACICVTAKAQDTGNGISIGNLKTNITGEKLDIGFDVKASGVDIECDGQLILEFAVENADRRLVMPVVVYSGKQRYLYERRRELLSDSYHVEPYHIYKGVKKNKAYELGYKISVPYYSWMEHAGITFREYTHDCSGDNQSGNGVLVADLNPAPVYVEPEVWKPDASLFPNLVSFLDPEVEEVKARASMISLNIGFPVNVTEVRPSFGNNAHELSRADSLITALQNRNELLDIRGVGICGYASPEGTYANNERLAKGRSQSFKQYLVNNYRSSEYIRDAHTTWVAEDWDGVGRLVQTNDTIAQKQDVLAIVYDNSIAPDRKDVMLQHIVWWSSNYKIILKDLYPKLRRIELKVDYTVHQLSDAQARELLYTNPDMLSLDEIYRVAKYYEHGSRQYREVYEIAAKQYPNDVIANNNAAAALLQEGNAAEALPYLEKTKGSNVSLINYGAYWYIMEDLDKATDYFNLAKAAGIEQAEQNLRLANPNYSK